MCRIYEDMIFKKIPSTRYEVLNVQYEDEQLKLTDELKELTTYMINEFVEKIIVYERDIKGAAISPQK